MTIDEENICMKYLLHLFNSKCSSKTQNFIFKKYIYRNVQKAYRERCINDMDKETRNLIEQLKTYSTPELCDGAIHNPAMDFGIQRKVTDKKVVGIAYTVDTGYCCSGIVPDAILAAEPESILVIDGHNYCGGSFWGDHRSICAVKKNLTAVIIDGAFRDIEGCEAAGFPIFARAVVPNSARKQTYGELNVPIHCGGQTVYPGDFIIGDANGVVVLRPNEVLPTLQRTDEKRKNEAYTIQKMEETGEILPRVIKPEEN